METLAVELSLYIPINTRVFTVFRHNRGDDHRERSNYDQL